MSENVEIRVVIDSSLIKFFVEGMRRRHIDISIQEQLAEFLAMILNDTMYPIISSKVGDHEIHLGYQPRAFADPIF